MKKFHLVAVCCAILAASLVGAKETETDAKSKATQKAALEKFNSLIGGWRGVGMPRRGSAKGAWIESADWVWEFKKSSIGIRYAVTKGKMLQTALLTYDLKSSNYKLSARFAGDVERQYVGQLKDKRLTMLSAADKQGHVYRVTVTRLNPKRTIVLHERRVGTRGLFVRIVEVGYTRKGTSLAIAGADGPECVVTGGKGTTRVSYKGQTYYVCCSGCRQAFEDDPKGVIADYEKRIAERKKKRAEK